MCGFSYQFHIEENNLVNFVPALRFVLDVTYYLLLFNILCFLCAFIPVIPSNMIALKRAHLWFSSVWNTKIEINTLKTNYNMGNWKKHGQKFCDILPI